MSIDGQAGPRFESLLWADGTAFNVNSTGAWVGQISVLFDRSGEHYAYAYKDGADTVIILDGQEVARAPMQPQLQLPLTFSKGGKYLAWGFDNHVFINGKPVPAAEGANVMNVYFSGDGKRYAAHCFAAGSLIQKIRSNCSSTAKR